MTVTVAALSDAASITNAADATTVVAADDDDDFYYTAADAVISTNVRKLPLLLI